MRCACNTPQAAGMGARHFGDVSSNLWCVYVSLILSDCVTGESISMRSYRITTKSTFCDGGYDGVEHNQADEVAAVGEVETDVEVI